MLTDYSPVYNVREIRSVCHSFAALGIDKKLTAADVMQPQPQQIMAASSPSPQNHSNNSVAEVTMRAHGITSAVTASVACPTAAAATTSTTINRGSVVMEAVHNDPANGYGKFVYI